MDAVERRAAALHEASKFLRQGRDSLGFYERDEVLRLAERFDWYLSTGQLQKPAGPPTPAKKV
jgi:hypothetical protein